MNDNNSDWVHTFDVPYNEDDVEIFNKAFEKENAMPDEECKDSTMDKKNYYYIYSPSEMAQSWRREYDNIRRRPESLKQSHPDRDIYTLCRALGSMLEKVILKNKTNKETAMFQPLGNRVLCEPIIEKEKEEQGKIIIPDPQKKESPYVKATVRRVGHEVANIKHNDKIFFNRHNSTELTIESKTFLLIKEPDIMGVVEKYA